MNIYDKINAGNYQPRSNYPSYTVEKSSRIKLIEKYDKEKLDLKNKFYLDICDEFDLKPSSRAHLLFDFAWDQAHSGGHTKIVMFLESLLDLIDSLEELK